MALREEVRGVSRSERILFRVTERDIDLLEEYIVLTTGIGA